MHLFSVTPIFVKMIRQKSEVFSNLILIKSGNMEKAVMKSLLNKFRTVKIEENFIKVYQTVHLNPLPSIDEREGRAQGIDAARKGRQREREREGGGRHTLRDPLSKPITFVP